MKYFTIPTTREIYAHSLLLSFYFVLTGVVARALSGFINPELDLLNSETIKTIVSVLVFSALLLPILKKTFPELRHWFFVYFFVLLFCRMFFF